MLDSDRALRIRVYWPLGAAVAITGVAGIIFKGEGGGGAGGANTSRGGEASRLAHAREKLLSVVSNTILK